KIAAVAFLTFVALDEKKKPIKVPKISPQSKEEKLLFMDGEERAKMRKIKRSQTKNIIESLDIYSNSHGLLISRDSIKRSQTKNIIESLDINKPWELE